MKMAASWAEKDMGLVVALLVGALTLGSASPLVLIGLCVLWGITVVADSTRRGDFDVEICFRRARNGTVSRNHRHGAS
jgi:hypothetical protein